MDDFRDRFKHLTGYDPFDWQERLFQKFLNGDFPDACDVPTGLGKTSVMAIWLIALGHLLKEKDRKIPLRLVYVVDRRVIVDQATEEAERLWEALRQALLDTSSPLNSLAQTLREASMKGHESLIALSTLRGQKADNREWCLDPSRPAIIVGTVDMIGSRLLFSGYGKVGINHRSLQAGLLGQDTIVVIDEAHLSPVFVATLLAIKKAVQKTPSLRPFHVMSLSATLGKQGKPFEIDELKELQNEQARLRLNAKKQIEFLPFEQTAKAKEGKKASRKEIDEAFAERLVDRVIQSERAAGPESAKSVVIFVRTVDLVNMIAEKLGSELEKLAVWNEAGESVDKKELKKMRDGIEGRVLKITGEMRGYERDKLVESPKFQAFLHERDRETPRPTQYLIATSSAEVGVNLDADDGLCDLSTLDSMIQRIGRINRFGKTEATITVVVDEKGLDAFESAYRQDEERRQIVSKLTAEIDQLQSRLITAPADKPAKKETRKEISAKESERKKLAKKVADNIAGNIEPTDAKLYFTWKALKAGEDETGRVNASPLALRDLLAANQKALPDTPVCPPFDEARIDDWAMTSLKQSDYPRPLVQYWLRGVIEDESAQTTFVWRLDLDHLDSADVSDNGDGRALLRRVIELATAIPIQPKERANVATPRAADLLKALAGKFPDRPVVLIDSGGEANAYPLLDFKEKDKNYIFATLAFSTVILPCSVGGLDDDGNPTANPKHSQRVTDVIEQEHKEWTRYVIVRHSSENYSIREYSQYNDGADEAQVFSSWQAAVRSVPKDKGVCDNAKEIQKAFAEVNEDEEGEARAASYIAFFFNPRAGRKEKKVSLEADRFLREDVDDVGSLDYPRELEQQTVREHNNYVEDYARNLAEKLGLPNEIVELLAAAGARHDLGKAREWWQKAVGNLEEFDTRPIAKSNKNSFDHSFNQGYRHEFGSLVESLEDEEIKAHPHRDLILHLIAAHHGYARPHFPERAFDHDLPKPRSRQIAHEAMLRFNRLQRQYGWWQLAYLEAVLKAADAMASYDFSRGRLKT